MPLLAARYSPAARPSPKPDRRTFPLCAGPAPDLLTVPLVLVQGQVGDLDQRLPVHSRPPGAQPDADLDRVRGPRAEIHGLDRISEPACNLPSSVRVGLGHGDGKLVATEPAADIGRSHHALQLLPHQLERGVAGAVPVAVVDLL